MLKTQRSSEIVQLMCLDRHLLALGSGAQGTLQVWQQDDWEDGPEVCLSLLPATIPLFLLLIHLDTCASLIVVFACRLQSEISFGNKFEPTCMAHPDTYLNKVCLFPDCVFPGTRNTPIPLSKSLRRVCLKNVFRLLLGLWMVEYSFGTSPLFPCCMNSLAGAQQFDV